MKFYKVHELGNDFVLFDGRNADSIDRIAPAKRVCDRHTGVGADGVLILLNSAIANVRMYSISANGSKAKTHVSGIRAFSRFCFENGVVFGTEFTVETENGVVRPRILLKNGRVDGVRVDMGEPLLEAKDVPVAVEGRATGMLLTEADRTFSFTSVRMGEPHTVVFVDRLDENDVAKYGPMIACNPLFPDGTNVDFVEVLSEERVRLCTWRRNTGYTLADGTGACSAAVACVLSGKTGRSVTIELPLGTLLVEWSEADNRVSLTGPAETVFSGVWNP